MVLISVILGILFIIFFFLYIQLHKELKTLHKQLTYSKEESSSFKLFTTSSDKKMKAIIEEVNEIRNKMQEEKDSHLHSEKEIHDMITNISHDIRTPLTSIQGYVEMMQNSDNPQERERYYQIVTQRLNDLESMLDEFFLYTKLMNTSNDLVLEESELYPLVCSSLLSYMDVLQSHDLQPIIVCENEDVKAYLHEESFKRICTNLIINTVRYGRNPFQITITENSEFVNVIFSNHVEHMTTDVKHLFDRFYKGNEARTQKGSGLGLAIVKELSEHMQGSVNAQVQDSKLMITVKCRKGRPI